MFNKKTFLFIFLFVVAIGTLSHVEASDSSYNILNNISDEELGIDSDDLSPDNLEIPKSEDSEILESYDDGTFTALQNKINNAAEGDTIYLDNDYYYNSNFQDNLGVKITKSLTINGNNHVIDGLGKSRLLNITDSKNIIFNNITFKNGNSLFGGAIASGDIDSFSLVGCSFVNNHADYYGGAVFSTSITDISVENCRFENNRIENDGGAIYFQDVGSSSFVDCSLINNSAYDCGGGILALTTGYFSFVNCTCRDNDAGYGGVIFSRKVNSSFVKDCSFINNVADTGSSIEIGFSDIVSCVNCTFEFNHINQQGDIYLNIVNDYFMDSCRFLNISAYGYGGAILLNRVINSKIYSSNFFNCSAYAGGTILCLNGMMDLKNLNITSSYAYMFGGAIAANCSDVNVNGCCFKNCNALKDAGGAIYNFKGNLTVDNSIFDTSLAWCGGFITSLQGNLIVSSSRFLEGFSYYGGSIYSMYGKINVDGSFFRNSFARSRGSSIYTMLSESAIFTNNIFLNSTSYKGSSIDVSYSNKEDVVDNGNHFEDVYHVVMKYDGYLNDMYFTRKSNVLNYVLSNDGTFLNSYENIESGNDIYSRGGFDLWGIGNRTSLNLWDANYPNNSTIFGSYNDIYDLRYNISKYFEDDEVEEIESTCYMYNGRGDEIQGSWYYFNWGLKNNESSLNLKDKMFNINNHIEIVEDTELKIYPVSLIDTVYSDSKSIPSHYDSRDYGYITPVQNQFDGGNCWAFSGIATLEACIKKATGITYDFSENNAKNLMALFSAIGLKLNTNQGGYDSMVMAYLNSWFGPINDEDDIYEDYAVLSIPKCSLYHVQNIVFLPPRQSSLDNDVYKKAIMDYGAVSITLNLLGVGHHAVSLVGWDDNYQGEDFLGDYTKGAWIFKNSWGTDWGDNGFAYLAYQHAFTSDLYDFCYAYTFAFDKNDSYAYNYQYDESGVSDYLYSENNVYYANKFRCESIDNREYLSAFATYFKTPTDYKVSVYINDALVSSQSGHSDAGYYTIPFNEQITLHRGDEFIIMVENCNDGENLFPVSQADELNRANYGVNTSFFSYDGINWFDLYNLEGYHEFLYGGTKKNTCQVACIKAFTSLYEKEFIFVYGDEFSNVELNEKITIKMDSLVGIDGSVITININGKNYYAPYTKGKAYLNISFDKAGDYTLTAQYKNNLFESNIVQFNFTVNRKNTSISASTVSKVYGGGESSVITLKDDKGNLITDAVVYFSVAGKTTKIKTNANGQAFMPINLAPKTYTATVSFITGGNYNGASVNVNIVVKKANSKLYAAKKTFKLKTKTKKYTITLKDNFGHVIKNAKVTLKIKGKTYKAKTNAKGKATFKIKKLRKKGEFKATIKFAGNAYYNPVTKKAKIIIKK